MNIVIDSGNSLIKMAVCEKGKIICKKTLESIVIDDIKAIFSEYPEIKTGILSAVNIFPENLLEFLKKTLESFIELDESTFLPIENQYKSPKTLGKDRLAGVVGACNIFPGFDVLVADLGTAITFDFINFKRQYLGGNISPGLATRFKALNYFTQKLPLLDSSEQFNLLGDSTESAIVSGVQNGIVFEIDGYIDLLKKKYSRMKVILTGGDAIFFEKRLKNNIFAEPELVILGLNHILEFNRK